MIFIRHTAVHWTYCGTLRLIVKTFALGTFICYYIIDFITNRFLNLVGIHGFPIWKNYLTLQIGPIGISPVISSFINRVVWTLRFASTAIYTFICNNNCHGLLFF